MLTTLIQNDMEFRKKLYSFLSLFNQNIDWNEEFYTWISKNKTDEQIYELIRSASWIDQDEEIDEKEFEKYVLITKCLYEDIDSKVKILDYNKTLTSTKIEQEMEMYRDTLESYLISRRITFEYIDEIEDGCIDFGWICRDDIDEIWENNSLIHINYLGLDKSIPCEYINEMVKIYRYVYND